MLKPYTEIDKFAKNEKFLWEMFDIFLIFAQNIDCGYTLEPPRRGSSNEYPQSMFWIKNKNKRTNGPVNAHLRPERYTCTNKLVRLEWYNACI